MKADIIRKAVIILGSYQGTNNQGMYSSSKITRAEQLAEEFINSIIEEVTLAVKWSFALKQLRNIEGSTEFTVIEHITDCIKIAVISPSNIQFYLDQGRIYFKGSRISSLFYYSRDFINGLLADDLRIWQQVTEAFKLLTALNLAASIAFAMYCDSLFADGLKKQYLIKLEQTKQIYSFNYNLDNSGEL